MSPSAAPPAARKGPKLALFVFVILGIWLSWQVIREVAAQRAPAEAALRLAPGSSLLLSRAAEAELAADRIENALWLARRAAQAAPFNVAALRTAGLALARQGRSDQADDILTLAGNWSLRDDRAHGWLVERRLQQGNYESAFAHADTLARRRTDVRGPIFDLLTTAARTDPRARQALAARLAPRPGWRPAYLGVLNRTPEGMGLSAGLAMALKDHAGRYDDREIAALYGRLAAAGQYAVARDVRTALAGRAPPLVADGDFARAEGRSPFEWTLHRRSGVTAEIATAPDGSGPALRVIHDTYASGVVATQTLMLAPGPYRLTARAYLTEGPAERLAWRISCEGGGQRLAEVRPASEQAGRWMTVQVDLRVPGQGCVAQRLALVPDPGDRRRTLDIWFDDMVIVEQ